MSQPTDAPHPSTDDGRSPDGPPPSDPSHNDEPHNDPRPAAHDAAHGHGHGRGTIGATPRWVRPATWVIGVLLVAAVALLWPTGNEAVEDPLGLAGDPIGAIVTRVDIRACSGTDEADGILCRFAELRVEDDPEPRALEQGSVEESLGLRRGDRILVNVTELPDGQLAVSFYDHQRGRSLLLLGAMFVGIVLVFGHWRGLGALGGLAASLLVIAGFILPAILEGRDPVLVALVGSAVIAFLALSLAHGQTLGTLVALTGTLASLALTGLLSWAFIRAAKFTGFTDDATFFLSALGAPVDARGVLLAGFVIGALGVLDDVTVTQVSAVGELRRQRPDEAIWRAAMTIGRDHVSSAVNTLFLAYAGAALPLLLLFSEARQSVSSIVVREVVATEIVRSLVGSIGLVASVPVTTWLAVRATAGPGFRPGASSTDAAEPG